MAEISISRISLTGEELHLAADITIEQMDESFVKVHCDPSILRELSDRFTFEVPNAKFSPAYKKRYWDGKIRLLNSKTHLLYAGLVPDIESFAFEQEYMVDDKTKINRTVEFSLNEANEFIKTLNIPYELREHQLRAFALAVRNKRCVLVSPTASGKSLIAYLITRYYNCKTLIVVPTISLVMQLNKDFVEYGFDGEIHSVMAGVQKHTDTDITLSTWQSIYEQPEEFFYDFDLIIGDEAHNFKSKSLVSIMSKMKNTPYRIGMTGTLDGAEVHELVLKGLFGKVENIVKTSTLIDAGSLAQLKIKILVLKHLKKPTFQNYQEEIEYIVSSSARNRFIRNLAASLKGNTLILYAYVEKHGKVLHEMIEKKRNNVHFVSGSVEGEIREDIRSIVEQSQDAIVVASYGVFSTGVNIKNLHNIIFASPTKSRIRTLQSIGRGLRVSDTKDKCTIFDIADDLSFKEKKNYTLNHMVERVKMYSGEGFPYEIHKIDIKEETNGSSLFEND